MSPAYFMRIALLPLVLFELVNAVGLLRVSNQPIWLGLLATSGGAFLGYEIWHKYHTRIGAHPLPPLSLVVGVIVVYVDAAGNLFDWYNQVQSFDMLIHFLSGFAATIIFFYLISRIVAAKGWRVPTLAVSYTALTSALLFGVGFEAVEYLADVYYQIDFWLGSGVDTLTDILIDMAGGLVALAALFFFRLTKS